MDDILKKLELFTEYNAVGNKINKKDVEDKIKMKDGNFFVVYRWEEGMARPNMDDYQMAITDRNLKIVLPLGSHPSAKGASTGFYKNRIKGQSTEDLKKQYSYMLMY